MAEIQKYSIREKLSEADRIYKGSPAVTGMSSMTHFKYTNSTRTQMFTSQLNQFINMPRAQFPLFMTGAENTAGKNSSGYKQLKSDIEIYRKVCKFEDLIDVPFVYQLFYYDMDKKRFDVVRRQPAKDLSQNYGFPYDNTFIDTLSVGDIVRAGTVLFKSKSYDKDMNYRYGVNLNTIYGFDPYCSEDAALVSEYASWMLSTYYSTIIRWGWNNNDMPINLHGSDTEYRPLPLLGDTVEGYLACSRPKIKEQMAFDFTHRNLSVVRDGDRVIEYNGTGTIIDYDIFCNNTDIKETSFTRQLIQMLESQNAYWQEIYNTCVDIRATGEDYSGKVDQLYKRAGKFLNHKPNERWFNGNSVFGDFEIHCHVVEESPLSSGGKFTARYGNKSVTAIVVPNHLMPFTKDGKRVDVILNQPAITNRTTGAVPHELYNNWITDLTVDEMKKTKSRAKQEKLMFDVMKDLNEKQYEQYYFNIYKKLSDEKKADFLDETMDNGIIIHLDSVNEDESIFFKFLRIRRKYKYLKKQTLYQYRWGQIYRIPMKYCLGKMYFMPLKQTDQRGFSGRSTGAVNIKGLPERSYKNKRNEAAFSDTPIRFGEYESLNFLIGLEPEELAVMHALYRSSPEATSDLTKSQYVNEKFHKFKKYYKSRAAEIFHVIFKSLGLEVKFGNKDNKLLSFDDRKLSMHQYEGHTYLCSDFQMHVTETRLRLKQEILNEKGFMKEEELNAEIERRLKKVPVMTGELLNMNIFGEEKSIDED